MEKKKENEENTNKKKKYKKKPLRSGVRESAFTVRAPPLISAEIFFKKMKKKNKRKRKRKRKRKKTLVSNIRRVRSSRKWCEVDSGTLQSTSKS